MIASGLPSQGREEDWFGVGTYLNLPDGEVLNNGRFAQQQSGVRIGAGDMSHGAIDDAEIKITLIKLPKRVRFIDLIASQYVNVALSGVLGQRGGGAVPEPGSVKVAVSRALAGSWRRWPAAWHRTTQQRTGARTGQTQGGIAIPAAEEAFNLTGVL